MRTFKVGDRIEHESFGTGTVIHVKPREFFNKATDSDIVIVKFDSVTHQVIEEVKISRSRTDYNIKDSDEYMFTSESLNQHLVKEPNEIYNTEDVEEIK